METPPSFRFLDIATNLAGSLIPPHTGVVYQMPKYTYSILVISHWKPM